MAEQKEKKQSLVVRTGARYGVDADKLLATLKNTAFRQKDKEITTEQMMALLVVAERYDLNPFVNELYAFPSKGGGIVPVVGVDGWTRLINRHPKFEGMEFAESDETKTMPGAKEAPVWMEVRIYIKDRRAPVVIREYLEEVYRPPTTKDDKTFDGPWQTHTRRMLRHKTIIQGGRVAFGLSGIYDEDEAQRVLEAQEQAIDAEIVPEIEDVEGKFAEIVKQHGFEDEQELVMLDKYLDETAATSQMTKAELMSNHVIAFTADQKEIDNFFESFQAWQEKNAPVTEGAPPSDGKRELIAEIDQMIEALDDPGMAEVILAKYKLKIGNMAVGNVEELEAVKREISGLIDKQTSMFKE